MLTNKVRRTLSCLLCVALLLGLAGCRKPAPTTTDDAAAATTQKAQSELTAEQLVGSWYYDVYWGDCMDLKSYTFASDGTFTYQENLLTPTRYVSELYTYGTFWSWSSWPTYEGTYTVTDGCLAISRTTWDYSAGKEITIVDTYSVQLLDGVLHLTDTETGEVEQFATGAHPPKNAAAPEVELSPLSGSWVSIRTGSGEEPLPPENVLHRRTVRFYSNGTFTIADREWFYQKDAETGEWDWESDGQGYYNDYGTFTFDGTTLVLTYLYNDYIVYENYVETYTVSSLNGTHLVIDDQWGTYINPQTVPYNGLEGLCKALGVEYAPTKK